MVFFSAHCDVCMHDSRSWGDLKSQIVSRNGAVHFLSVDTPAEVATYSKGNPELPIVAVPSGVQGAHYAEPRTAATPWCARTSHRNPVTPLLAFTATRLPSAVLMLTPLKLQFCAF